MANLRTKGKSTIVWILMGLLILGLGGFGVTSFTGGSSKIGSVGDTDITANDYARALQTQLNNLSQQTGQPFTMTQAEAIGLPGAVQAQLLTAAVLEEQTHRMGISVGDEQIAKAIAEAPAFQGPNGDFDRVAYSQVLQRQGMTEAEFETQIRTDEARRLLQRAVTEGISVPQVMLDRLSGWRLEKRDFTWRELTEEDLQTAVAEPDEETLKSWHTANSDRFTAPETRKLTYAWLTPEMMKDEVELDEDALRAAYEQNIDKYRQPERRLVGRLVFPSQEEAQAAKERLESGEASFRQIVEGRGLTLEDIDLGEVTQEELGAAGETVFATDQNGVVGPVGTDLGPALFSVNAILDPVDIPFEEAREELGAEAALDRAGRMISDRSGEYEDLLASGATLEEAAEETPMELGTLEWSDETEASEGSIAGYPGFRQSAEEVVEGDFPRIERLEDGGIFALRLDEIVPPSLIPFEDVRDQVAEDWRKAEVHRLLLARADETRLALTTEVKPVGDPAGTTPDLSEARQEEWTPETGITRDGWIEALPQPVIEEAFNIAKPGEYKVADVDGRVFLLQLDAVHEADLNGKDAMRIKETLRESVGESIQRDVFDAYTQAVRKELNIEINQSAINAVNSQMR